MPVKKIGINNLIKIAYMPLPGIAQHNTTQLISHFFIINSTQPQRRRRRRRVPDLEKQSKEAND